MKNPRFLTLSSMILIAAIARLIPHPWNVTPVAAMALFAGAHFERRSQAFFVPLAALFLSDAVLGFHRTMPFVYAAVALTVAIGIFVAHRRSSLALVTASLGGSLMFFILTNFGYWITTEAFPQTLAGLMQCYTAAIPFFRNTMAGDMIFTAVLFGSFALAERSVPRLQRTTA